MNASGTTARFGICSLFWKFWKNKRSIRNFRLVQCRRKKGFLDPSFSQKDLKKSKIKTSCYPQLLKMVGVPWVGKA